MREQLITKALEAAFGTRDLRMKETIIYINDKVDVALGIYEDDDSSICEIKYVTSVAYYSKNREYIIDKLEIELLTDIMGLIKYGYFTDSEKPIKK